MSEGWAEGMPDNLKADFEGGVTAGIKSWQNNLAEAERNVSKPSTILLTLLLTERKGENLNVWGHAFSSSGPEDVLSMIREQSCGAPSSKNCTMIPEELLLRPRTVPILLIRDPRAAVPSAYRVLRDMDLPHGSGRPNFLISTASRWNRQLYDYFIAKGVEPVVVDGDDVMANPPVIRHLCSKLGMDPEQAIFSWPKVTQEEKDKLHPYEYASGRNLFESTGTQPSRAARNRNLEAEEKEWDADFGEDVALVKEMVERALPDYRYLYERRLRA